VHALIEELLAFQPADVPVVSLYMDTRPGEAGRSQGRRHRDAFVWLKRRMSEVASASPVRGPGHESLAHDLERIQRFLEESLDPATRGLALFACHGCGLFRAHQFQLPFANELMVDAAPHIYPLARLLDGHSTCAAVLVDSEHARIYTIAMGRAVQETRLHRPLERPEKAGRPGGAGRISSVGTARAFGATQLRYQRYLEGQVHQHLRGVAEHLERLLLQEKLAYVIVGGHESTAAELVRLLPRLVQERVLDRVQMETDTPENDVLRMALKILEARMAVERTRKVDWLCQEDLAEGPGALGLARTLRALNDGNIDELVFAASFSATGLVCTACDQLLDFADELGRCRYCSGAVRAVTDLREVMVERAERLGHPWLAGPAGVGAILRYRPGSAVRLAESEEATDRQG